MCCACFCSCCIHIHSVHVSVSVCFSFVRSFFSGWHNFIKKPFISILILPVSDLICSLVHCFFCVCCLFLSSSWASKSKPKSNKESDYFHSGFYVIWPFASDSFYKTREKKKLIIKSNLNGRRIGEQCRDSMKRRWNCEWRSKRVSDPVCDASECGCESARQQHGKQQIFFIAQAHDTSRQITRIYTLLHTLLMHISTSTYIHIQAHISYHLNVFNEANIALWIQPICFINQSSRINQ